MLLKRFSCVAIMALGVTSAVAAPVASTAKKGSLLVFPLITIDEATRSNTIVQITNDEASNVKLECYYVNEWKGRNDFTIFLSGKATVSWDVATRSGDRVIPQVFPSTGNYPAFGSRRRGELVCFAVDPTVSRQIAFNHLHGSATVLKNGSSFKYNAWAFQALNAAALPENNNVTIGTAGRLDLTGLPRAYDACPVYNAISFSPNGARLGGVSTVSNDLSFVSCNQDLRQDYSLHLTKLQFQVWNSAETNFSGAFYCADGVRTLSLGGSAPGLVIGTNFDYSALRTPTARFAVQGVRSTQCSGSEPAGLLGVVTTSITSGTPAVGSIIGSTTHAAGSTSGYVLWDPAISSTPFSVK